MERQQFGTIATPEGPATAMLCIDADLPNDFMIQWWNEEKSVGFGVISDATWNGKTVRLAPKNLHRIGVNGAILRAVPFSDEELKWVRGSHAELTETDDGLTGNWFGLEGFSGPITLANPTKYPDLAADRCDSWASFKVWADKVRADASAVWFRGHGSVAFPLQTSFHRVGRTRLERYCYAELIQFQSQAEAVFNRRFEMHDANDYATVIGLARHHGMPTPLLDWTASPYIAAFFAFSDVLENPNYRRDANDVRIFGLSPEYIRMLDLPTIVVPWVKPYVGTLTIGPLHNPRLGAQQGHFIVTNISDLRSSIYLAEQWSGKRVLSAVDVPMSCAGEALKDLAFMGVTAATMFPGLDGVGRKLRHEMTYDAP